MVSIFNIQNYLEQKKSINNSLNVSLNKRDRKIPPAKIKERNDIDNVENRNIKFMDSVIYTVLLDDNDNILDVINHSNNGVSNEKISELSIKILKDKKIKARYIGCLYLSA